MTSELISEFASLNINVEPPAPPKLNRMQIAKNELLILLRSHRISKNYLNENREVLIDVFKDRAYRFHWIAKLPLALNELNVIHDKIDSIVKEAVAFLGTEHTLERFNAWLTLMKLPIQDSITKAKKFFKRRVFLNIYDMIDNRWEARKKSLGELFSYTFPDLVFPKEEILKLRRRGFDVRVFLHDFSLLRRRRRGTRKTKSTQSRGTRVVQSTT
jgi:hypothetical protein